MEGMKYYVNMIIEKKEDDMKATLTKTNRLSLIHLILVVALLIGVTGPALAGDTIKIGMLCSKSGSCG